MKHLRRAITSILAGCLALVAASPLAAAAPLTAGNLLVSTIDMVYEFTPAGLQVQSFNVSYGGGARPATEGARDLVVGIDGKVHVYDGTFEPYMDTLDPVTSTWSGVTYPEWSTVNNVTFGGIAAFNDYVFVTDMGTSGGLASGIVRFDLAGGTAMRFASATSTIDLTMGLDSSLYVLDDSGYHVDVYDPTTLAHVSALDLSYPTRGIAVDASGRIFGASSDGSIHRFDTNGNETAALQTTAGNLADIDIDAAGHIVVGSWFGGVAQTDASLASATSFNPGGDVNFVAFVSPLGGSSSAASGTGGAAGGTGGAASGAGGAASGTGGAASGTGGAASGTGGAAGGTGGAGETSSTSSSSTASAGGLTPGENGGCHCALPGARDARAPAGLLLLCLLALRRRPGRISHDAATTKAETQ